MEPMDKRHSFMAVPTTFVSGGSSVISERMFTSFFFAVSKPLPIPILVCDRVYRTLASDPNGYTFSGVCGDSKAIATERVFVGITYWSMMYGYPEHRRYLTCINQDEHRKFTSQAAVMQQVFRAIFASLAISVVQDYQDYRIPMQQLTTSTWNVNWFA